MGREADVARLRADLGSILWALQSCAPVLWNEFLLNFPFPDPILILILELNGHPCCRICMPRPISDSKSLSYPIRNLALPDMDFPSSSSRSNFSRAIGGNILDVRTTIATLFGEKAAP